MSEDKFIIPVDSAKEKFIAHLNANPRTILSSKFGDGKSYFIDKVKGDIEISDSFEFITLYPVNYQITSNKDIFELIKRDILFQLMIHNMISDRVVISKDAALSFFISNNGISIVQDLIPYFAEVALSPDDCKRVLLSFKSLKVFKNIKEKFNKFVNEFGEDEKIEKFLIRVDNSFVYEEDIVTYLIRKSIADYKSRTSKSVALFIEDLDRIDPAHLFRILNVFSAHLDFCYKYGVKPDDSLLGNKFGLDNVVLVIDYSNMKKIYKHFYGPDTDFNGYISKFTSSAPFFYSLKEERTKYIINEIVRITGAPESMVKILVPMERIDPLSLRKIINSFNIGKQIKRKPLYRYNNKTVLLDQTILRLLAVMVRLGIPKEVLDETVKVLRKKDVLLFYRYATPYLFLLNSKANDGLSTDITLLDSEGYLRKHVLLLDENTGTCECKTRFMNIEKKETDLTNLCLEIQKFIVI